jgi:nucleoside-diphosphate-sugar epimerase
MAPTIISMCMLILGGGHVGRALAAAAARAQWSVRVVSRRAAPGVDQVADLATAAGVARALDTEVAVAVVTAPPQSLAPELWPTLAKRAARRVLLGTTGIYARTGSDANLRESSALDPGHPRFALETAFVRDGGHVVRLAGLYGGDRDPVRWLVEGRIGVSDRQVNFVHHEDVATFLLRCIDRLPPVVHLADGQHHSWRDIARWAQARGLLGQVREDDGRRPNAFVDSALARRLAGDDVFRDFFSALAAIPRDFPPTPSGYT